MQNAAHTHAPRMNYGPGFVNPRSCSAKDLRSGVASVTDSGMLLASGAVQEATGSPQRGSKESSWAPAHGRTTVHARKAVSMPKGRADSDGVPVVAGRSGAVEWSAYHQGWPAAGAGPRDRRLGMNIAHRATYEPPGAKTNECRRR